MKYMKEDYVGAASRVVYALKGDEVEIIREDTAGLLFVQAKNGKRFHIWPEYISDEPVKPVQNATVSNKKSTTTLKPKTTTTGRKKK